MMNHSEAHVNPRLEDVQQAFDLQRVKVYRLNKEGTWDDKGTGLISLQKLEQSAAMGMVVMAEVAPHKPLLIHRLSTSQIYSQQGGTDETIISWSDAEAGTDIAISFQEAAGCKQMWTQIQIQQARERSQFAGERDMRRPMIDEMEPNGGSRDDMRDAGSVPVELPAPEMGNIEQIAKILSDLTNFQREHVAHQMLAGNYVRKILDIFRSSEDLEDQETLRHLFEIVRNIVMLNDTGLLEILFAEENVMDMVGALEYDPELHSQQKHRQFLRDVVVFKEVIPIRRPGLKAKIHQTYRMAYVKDVILPRLLDDGTYATLASLIMFNNVEVVLALMDEPDFFRELFRKFRASKLGSEAWSDIVTFLSELTGLAKSLQQMNRTALLSKLIQLGLFEALTEILEHGSQAMQLKATDVLISVVQHDPVPLREFLLRQPPADKGGQGTRESPLFTRLAELLTLGAGGGLQEQVTEILRALLDPESMTQNTEKNEFLEKFYNAYVKQLIGVIESGTNRSLQPGEGPCPAALGLIVEILCFCVQHHGYRMKYYALTNHTMEAVLKLLHRKERWLTIAGIRFIRACLSLKDNFYNRHMVNFNIFEPIITVFVANGERYNLLNSVVLEMVDFIRRENLKELIEHFMEKHWSRVEDVDYDLTFLKLRDKYEQGLERSTDIRAASAQLREQRTRKDERALDKAEEKYFEGGDEDDVGTQAMLPRRSNGVIGSLQMNAYPLVDYEDDDEDTNHPVTGQKRTENGQSSREQEKRARFLDHNQPRRFQVSPPLLKPRGSLDWRHG